MKVFESSWRTFAVRLAALGMVVFGAVRLAVARDGVTGGPARSFVTVAGTLTGVSGATPVTFEFRRASSPTTVLCAPQVTITPGTGGTFSVPVPLDQPELPARCPDDLFDGRDVQVRVLVRENEVATWAPINPVPYAHFASVAGQVGVNNDCPAGYVRDTSDPMITTAMRLCVRTIASGRDEVVRVGSGASAFWIDRYEAWVVEVLPDGRENGRFTGLTDFGALPRNGQWRTTTQGTPPSFAWSRAGANPARYITWFQAQEACRASGKRLPTGDEWLTAAQGTTDRGDMPGTTGECRTGNGSGGPAPGEPRTTGLGSMNCVSAWGAQDMIGNLWEWTGEWYAGAVENTAITQINLDMGRVTGTGTVGPREAISTWPTNPGHDYFGDGTSQVGGQVSNGIVQTTGLPSALVRGGDFQSGTRGGRFALHMGLAPSALGGNIGFRCVIPR